VGPRGARPVKTGGGAFDSGGDAESGGEAEFDGAAEFGGSAGRAAAGGGGSPIYTMRHGATEVPAKPTPGAGVVILVAGVVMTLADFILGRTRVSETNDIRTRLRRMRKV